MQSMGHTESESPCATARQMEFKEVGVMRWTWVLLVGMEEKVADTGRGPGESEGWTGQCCALAVYR